MNREALIQQAIDLGFAAADLIETGEIPFQPEFRICCEDNMCGMYGVNYACPPDCGTTDEMREAVLAKKQAMVFQTIWEIPDLDDKQLIKKDKLTHNAMVRKWMEGLSEEMSGGFMIAASGCSVCPVCSIVDGKPCRFPELKASCMSAYCIYVAKLCEKLGWEYDYGPGLVAFFGMYVF